MGNYPEEEFGGSEDKEALNEQYFAKVRDMTAKKGKKKGKRKN